MAQVSVIIPVYNIERHLRQCLDSVTGQTLTELEIICVDDGSTDASPEILADYAQRDGRFQIITQPNTGPGVARNTGMDRATGEYLIFLDSDDWFEPDFLERMVAKAKETGADVTICRTVEFDTQTGRELPSEWMLKTEGLPKTPWFSPKEAAASLFSFTWGWPWDKLYRTQYLRQGGFSYPALPNSEDLSFVFLSLAGAARLTVVDTVLVHHRVNRGASVSNSRSSHPEAPYQAIRLLEEELKARGLYSVFEQSFLNWALGFLIWNTASMEDPAVQKRCYYLLRHEWLPAFPFPAHPVGYYSPFTYAKFLLARFAPRRIFYGVVRSYHHWKRAREGR